ncbi:MAG: hypothetical protein ACO20H_04950 [Bacteriovoracaceae bacterium]
MKYFTFLTIFISSTLFSFPRGISKKPFEVKVFAPSDARGYAQALTEYRMAHETGQCRGAFIATPSKAWDCKATPRNPNRVGCSRMYKCSRISKKINRSTLIASTRNKMKRFKTKVAEDEIKIIMPPKKALALESGDMARKREQLKLWKIQLAQKEKEEKQRQARLSKLKDVLPNEPEVSDDNEIMEFLKSEGLSPDDIRDEEDIKAFLKREKVSDDVVYRDYDPFTDEDVKWVLQTTIEPDGMTKVYKLRRLTSSDDRFIREFQWFRASASMVEVSSEGDSLRTTNVSWTPYYLFNERWTLRGNAGIHFIKEAEGSTENSFSLLELGVYAQYNPNRLYYEFGAGFQVWNNQTGDRHLYTAFGLGYVFDIPLFRYIDRVFTNYTLVSNPESNREFKLGVGFAF